MTHTEDWLEAYLDCRKNKRGTVSAVEYEMICEERLVELKERINNRTYLPGRSICFVVRIPRYREVFAASFEDRIVHHYAALRLEPLFERVFNERTFNCRKGKGQLLGVRILIEDIRECSENYTKDCYVMKHDLSGFFMSINKAMLAGMIDTFIVENYKGEDIEDLRFICKVLIMHEPEKDCLRKSPDEYWEHLSANKSLFTNGEGLGIAIGNLFAQLFANFLLNAIDWLLERIIGEYHGRYVDDIYCVHKDKAVLLAAIPVLRDKLGRLGLRLNERKFYLQHYSKGVKFTGAVVMPGRIYSAMTTAEHFVRAVKRLDNAAFREDIEDIRTAVASVNSYLGILRHYDEYGMRRRVLNILHHDTYRYIYITDKFRNVVLKKRYREGYEIRRLVNLGDIDGALCA